MAPDSRSYMATSVLKLPYIDHRRELAEYCIDSLLPSADHSKSETSPSIPTSRARAPIDTIHRVLRTRVSERSAADGMNVKRFMVSTLATIPDALVRSCSEREASVSE